MITQQQIDRAVVLLPTLLLPLVAWEAWNHGVSSLDLTLFLVMYALTGLGISVGYHRMLTHRAFKTVTPVRVLLLLFGEMAAEGPAWWWTAVHRLHHAHSDETLDPHSPKKGWGHAHYWWMLSYDIPISGYKLIVDLRKDRVLAIFGKFHAVIVILGLLIPALLGGIITNDWHGAYTAFLWGGIARLVFVQQATWSVNSFCHMFGWRPYETNDLSTNNPIFGLLSTGEGWHNNHHAFQTSARLGLRWWEIDWGYYVIRLLELCRLVWDVKRPTESQMQARLRPKLSHANNS